MTENEKIQEIDRQIAAILRHADERINKYTLQAAEDFMNFFHWNAGNMYKTQMEYRYFKEIKTLAKVGDLDEIARMLCRLIAKIEHEILDASPFGSCTNEIVNAEHRLQIDGKREIRNELQKLIHIAQYVG
ncbi:hypothetical protein E7745_14370 [Duncaniella sp. C9]|uniref:hypothetical protein n=1 Tax=Muribaculaceae TaxID=2005473 RepID=UPI0010A534F8|nr:MULTISPECIES: hypothetical protein [Muribaculaceae]QCD40613.1 hypothetical protein E7745_14370 [Duncaniella sp. C9]QCP71718.1 hypothetical protein FDZ78_03610 [Duncaniella sp. B8]